MQDDQPSASLEQPAITELGMRRSLADDIALGEEINDFEDDVKTSDNSPLREWANLHRTTYLDELIRHEGRAGVHTCHSHCGKEGIYRCKDCFGTRTLCRDCFVAEHSHTPFHRPQVRLVFVVLIVPLTHSVVLLAMDRRVF